jgi:hypothetical protein
VTVAHEQAQRLDRLRTIAALPFASASGKKIAKHISRIFGVFAMIIACAAVLAVVVASASPLPAAPTSQAAEPKFVVTGTVTAQIEPKDFSTRRPTVCTEQYAPVCGRASGVLKTYSNQCYARADGADVITQGPCADPVVQPGPR